MKKIFNLYILFLLTSIFFACDKNDDKNKDHSAPILEITQEELVQNFTFNGSSKYITVTSNKQITASSSDLDWCTTMVLVDQTKGNLRITVGKNTSDSARETKVTIKADGIDPVEIVIKQQGSPNLSLEYPDVPIIPTQTGPVANLFDVVFFNKGAYDRSGNVEVLTPGSDGTPITTFKNTFNSFMATFEKNGNKYFKIPYVDNENIKNALSTKFTLETYYKSATTSNVCPLSAQESGGIGIEQASGGKTELWIRISGAWLSPKAGGFTVDTESYNHIIFTYDKSAGEVSCYLNGQLYNTVASSGDFTFPSNEDAHWFALGGDASTGESAQYAFQGDMLFARLYDKAITAGEASTLYNQIGTKQTLSGIDVIISYITKDLPTLAESADIPPDFVKVINDAISLGWEIVNNYTVNQDVVNEYKEYVEALLAL